MRFLTRARSAAAFTLAAALSASAAAAAEGLPLDRFDPAPAGDRMFNVPSPDVAGHLVPQVAVLLDYAHNPLVFRPTQGAGAAALVSSQLFLHVNASLALWGRVALNLEMPFALMQVGTNVQTGGQVMRAPDQAQLGDLRAGVRVRLAGASGDAFQLGLGGYVWIPTAPSDGYTGAGKVRGMPQLLMGGSSDRVVWSLVAGPKLQGTQTFAGVSQGTELVVGAGLGVLLLDDRSLQIGPEVYSAFMLVKGDNAVNDAAKRTSNIEVLADARYRINDVELGAGAGTGLTIGLGTPDFRGVLMAAYRPRLKERAPVTPRQEMAGVREAGGARAERGDLPVERAALAASP